MTQSRRRDIGAVLIILVLVALFFHKALFSDRVFFYFDISSLQTPLRLFNQQMAQRGCLPLWCPNIFVGFPVLAEWQGGTFYPPNWLFLLPLPVIDLFKWVTALHYLLAGLFTYLYARRVGLDELCALLAGVVFGFCGFMVARLIHTGIVNAAVWLPLELLLIESALERRSWRAAVGAGGVFAVQLFTGHPQAPFYSALAVTLYVLVWMLWSAVACHCPPRRTSASRCTPKVVHGFAVLAVFFAVAVPLAAIQLLPSAEITGLSERAGSSLKFIRSYAFHRKHLLTFLLPDFFGTPVTNTYHGRSVYWEMCGFIGVLPLLLAVVGAVFTRTRIGLYFTLLAVGSIAMSLAKINPIYHVLVHVPGFNAFRCPVRFLYLYSFAAAVLSGFGLQAICRGDLRLRACALLSRMAVGLVVAGVLTAIALTFIARDTSPVARPESVTADSPDAPSERPEPRDRGRLATWQQAFRFSNPDLLSMFFVCICAWLLARRTTSPLEARTCSGHLLNKLRPPHPERSHVGLVSGLLVALAAFELFRFGMRYNPLISRAYYETRPATANAISNLKSQISDFRDRVRVFTWKTSEYFERHCQRYSDWHVEAEPFMRKREMLSTNEVLFHDVWTVGGFASFGLRRVTRFRAALEGTPKEELRGKGPAPNAKLMSMVNARYALSPRAIRDENLAFVGEAKGMKVYENRRTLPRCMVVGQAQVVPDAAAALDAVRQPAFDPRTTVILENVDSRLPTGAADPCHPSPVTRHRPMEVVVKVGETRPDPRDGFLVLNDTWYPGWRAYVDGQATRIYPANSVVRAVSLPTGRAEVRFVFAPQSLRLGQAVSLAALFVLAVMTALSLARRFPNIQGDNELNGFSNPPWRTHQRIRRSRMRHPLEVRYPLERTPLSH